MFLANFKVFYKNLLYNKEKIYKSLFLFILWFLYTIFTAWFAKYLIIFHKPKHDIKEAYHFNHFVPSFFDRFIYWDPSAYMCIGFYGYYQPDIHKIPFIAFFPGYPIIVRIIYLLTHSLYPLLYYTPSIFMFFLSIYYLYLLLETFNFNKKTIITTLLFYIFYPTSFFAFSSHNVSALNLFSILTFYNVRKKNFLLASIFSGIGTLFGPMAVFLSIIVVLGYVHQNNERFDVNLIINTIKNKKYLKNIILYSILSVSGILLFSFYCLFAFHNFFEYVSAQNFWGKYSTLFRILLIFIFLITESFPVMPLNNFGGVVFLSHFINFIFFISFIYIISKTYKQMSYYYLLFSIIIVVEYFWHVGSLSFSILAFSRIIYLVIPLFIGIAYLLEQEEMFISILPLYVVSNFILESLFTKGYLIL